MATVHKIRGVSGVLRQMRRLDYVTGAKVERALMKAGLFILRQSQKIVPIDTGALKNSGRVGKQGKGWNTQVTVEYTMGYALSVHENLDARHKKGKQAKFVETPMRAHRNTILLMLQRDLR